MTGFRVIHTADIHLDSPLRSLAMRQEGLAELIGNATRLAFTRIVDLCLEERVDALLIAGDLYDGDQTSMKTARFMAQQLERVTAAGIAVYIVRGNHDALSKITKELVLPEQVHIFSGRAEAIAHARTPGDRPVYLHGLSFSQPRAPESLLGKYKPPVADAINIGMLHTSLAGAPGHDAYAPCALAELHGSGFDYWALGHVHKRDAYTGPCTVVMPGTPQGRDINEAGAKSATLVTVRDDGTVLVEERITSHAEFARITVDVGGISEWADLAVAIEEHLRAARAGARSEHLVARLNLTGATPLAWRIRRDRDLLAAEALHRGERIGKCWIEQLDSACIADAVAAKESDGPLIELDRLMKDTVLPSDDFRSELQKIVDELSRKLPADCRDLFGRDAADVATALEQLAREGKEEMLARLTARGQETN